jgi:hypothetical protein
MSLDEATQKASLRDCDCTSETDFKALLKWVEKIYGRNNASSAPSCLDQFHTSLMLTSKTIDQFIGRVMDLLQALEVRAGRCTGPSPR